MSARAFSSPDVRRRVREAVGRVESVTGAELVVTLRQGSGDYRGADHLVGGIVALIALLALLFLPQSFALVAFPLDVTLAFLAGRWLSARTPDLRRALTPAARRRENVRTAARAAFVDQGIHALPGRNALLVYVSLLEREAEVVLDVGLRAAEQAEGWSEAVRRIQAAAARLDAQDLPDALSTLGPVLARVLPRGADDVNELPDEASVE